MAFTFDTLGLSGDNVLYVSVDPGNSISESNENNNLASFTITVSPPGLPDLEITNESIALSTASAREGDTVTVTATIRNRGRQPGIFPCISISATLHPVVF